MCSRKLTLWLLVAILIPACGRKEPPQPPPSKTPAPLNDLQIQQRGPEILLQMSYPSITLSGLPIEDLEAIEIWKTIRIVPSFAETEIELPGAEIAGEDTQVEAPPACLVRQPQPRQRSRRKT
jgi:predicted small lipoprotein YifL